jgi:hypothetical protein
LKHRQQTARRSSTALSLIKTAPSVKAGWVWLGVFAVVVALLGGSSRFDPIQIAALRPLSALLLIPAFYYLAAADLRRGTALCVLLLLTALWMALQLIPLPHSIWAGLPDRGVIAEIDLMIGLGDTWRPVSMAPFRGWNALASLVVPVAALLLALAFKANPRQLLLLIVGIGLIDAGFGLLQVIGGSRSPLYLFAITSRGAPAGIFANENHSAVFSALVLLVLARLVQSSRTEGDPAWLRLAYAPASIFILLAILVSGSRAGFATALAALLVSGMMIWLGSEKPSHQSQKKARSASTMRLSGRLLTPIFLGVVAVMLATFLWLERTPAFQDIMAVDAFEDLRWSLWPILKDMAANHWLVGTGVGSFDAVYLLYEPTSLLLPRYVNQAHNDWAQIVIEGGLPAVGLVSGAMIWIGVCLWALIRKGATVLVLFWLAVLTILAAASGVDYPLRTPVFQAVLVWLLLTLGWDRHAISQPEQRK